MQSMSEARLRKHGDYQRVYHESRKHFSASMAYFYAPRSSGSRAGPRIGLTAGRVLGKAVERNRIKRRMREAIRLSLTELTRDVDVVLHPRRGVLTADFPGLRREVSKIFSIIERSASFEKPGHPREGER
jgi:ribonuclease P protein component